MKKLKITFFLLFTMIKEMLYLLFVPVYLTERKNWQVDLDKIKEIENENIKDKSK